MPRVLDAGSGGYADLLAASIHNWRARIAADDVGRGKKINGHILTVGSSVWTKVTRFVELLQFLGRVEWFAAGVFFDDAG